jgi:hypothetical protein
MRGGTQGLSRELEETAESYARLAAELRGTELTAGVKALARAGLINLASREGGFAAARAALRAVAETAPDLALAAGMNFLAADLIFRWGSCTAMKLLGRLHHGQAIATLVDEEGPDGPRIVGRDSERTVEGRAERVVLAPVADLLVTVTVQERAACVLALSRDLPGIEIEAGPGGEDGAPWAAVKFRGMRLAREQVVGCPLPESEPGELRARKARIVSAVLAVRG